MNKRKKDFLNIKDSLSNTIKFDNEHCFVSQGDSLELLKKIPSQSISLILTDPPYHSTKKKNIKGDSDFKEDKDFLNWIGEYIKEWQRILKPNGSIYCFCSSKMSNSVENKFREMFNVLANIVWTKPNEKGFDGWKQKMKKENLRQWYLDSERIIFAEPKFNGYTTGTYLGNFIKDVRIKSKMSAKDLAECIGAYGKINHGGAVCNWETGRNIPSKEQYDKLCKVIVNIGIIKHMPDYDDIVRVFNISSNTPFTDVWNFKTVKPYKGKHPAEKPLDMLNHIIQVSTNENDIVLDCFSGSGSTVLSALQLKRYGIGIEIEPNWVDYSIQAIKTYIEKGNIILNKNNISHEEDSLSLF